MSSSCWKNFINRKRSCRGGANAETIDRNHRAACCTGADILYRDSLTGAYNRRYYEEVVRKTIGPAGVALLDVDNFKICNDTYGHYAGDMALKTAANAIQSCIRESDLLIRYSGDEFLLVLPGIPGDFLQTKLEQIRAALKEELQQHN